MAFDEITTDMVTGAEEQEVTDPAPETEETGAEEPEVTEPASEEQPEEETGTKTAADKAFAEMRRRAEEAEQRMHEVQTELDALRAAQEARQAALANMDIDEVEAIAESLGITREEVLENIAREEEAAEAEIESKAKDQQIEALQARIDEVEAEKLMAEDLATLKKLDPKIESLDDMGDDYVAYISAGLTAEQAYYAIRGRDIATKATPAKPPGRIEESKPPEKDYFTEEEVANMTSEQKTANWEGILKSLPKWKKK